MNLNEKSIFAEAIEKETPAQRAAFLDEACAGRPDIRQKVESLISAYPEGAFLEDLAHDATAELSISGESVGTYIGPYKLLEKIGEGGMGVVYMADQREPIKRRVALKVVKAGMDTKQVIGRFEAERQALALMDHPNIAKVLDAGATETGRPYFVMELVRGIAITQFCDEHKLTPKERLELFIPVCHAIQHAHQKAIIHRDVKPSNVLVTMHDDKPVPKVIDFGIAKATHSELTVRTVFTRFQQFIGTPAYMSPEQAQMTGLDIDTRCDIYSLGVLLYELLIGTTPFDAQELMKGGYDEICRRIREDEPVKPSSRVSTMEAASRTSLAKSRQTDPNQLGRLLRGDLDWITMKAMEKDRTHRYETANGLALDIKRFLASEPVLARKPSTLYRFRKLAYRNKTAVITATAFVAVLILGTVIASWLAYHARWQRDLTQQALDREKSALQIAEQKEEHARLAAERADGARYIANMMLIQHDWERTNIARVKQLLDDTHEYLDRGFEWYYWQRQMHTDVRAFVGHTDAIRAAVFSPDEMLLATASHDGTAIIWDILSGEKRHTLRHDGGYVRTVEFSNDGNQVLTSGEDTTARIWDTNTGKERMVFQGHAGGIYSAHFSPDEQWIITGSADKTAKIWDVSTKQMRCKLPGHLGMVWATAFSPDGRWVATAAHQDPTVRLWDASTGRPVRQLHHDHPKGATCVAFSPDSTRVVTGDFGDTARVWDVANGDEPVLTLVGHTATLWSVEFSTDGTKILTGSNDQTARIWDAKTGVEVEIIRGHTAPVAAASFSPTGRWVATSVFWGDLTVRLWDMHSARQFPASSEAATKVLACWPDGARVIVEGTDSSAKVLNTSSGRIEHVLEGHLGRVTSAAVSPDGQWIVTGSLDRSAIIWDAATGDPLGKLVGRHTGGVVSVAVSRDGRRIVTGSDDRTAVLWDAATYEDLQQFVAPKDIGISSVAIAPNGAWIVSSGNETIVWDSATGNEIRRLETGLGSTAVAVSPDGRQIAAGTWYESRGFVWDARTGKELVQLKGHTIPMTCMAFSPDGKRIVTGAWDGAKLWDTRTGREVLTFKGHKQDVDVVAFCSPTGREILTASADSRFMWKAASPKQVAVWKEQEEARIELAATLRQQQDEAHERDRILERTDEGSIKQWLILGPIPMPIDAAGKPDGEAALDEEQIEQEHLLGQEHVDRISIGQREFTWRKIQLEGSHFSFDDDEIFGPGTGPGVAYAVCYVHSDRARRGLRLKIGGGENARVYLNRQEIYKSVQGTGDDLAVEVELIKGRNVLVFKSVNGGGQWRGSVRFTNEAAGPVSGIKVGIGKE